MNKLRSITTTAEYTQTVCPHYSALCPRKPAVLVYINVHSHGRLRWQCHVVWKTYCIHP